MKISKLKYKRRREGKTDYKARFFLLKGGLPRLVVRKTNKYILAQVTIAKEAQDFVEMGISSKHLASLGWTFSFKNLPAAYMTGFLLGKKALEKNIKKMIIDTGIIKSTKGSKIYAFVKGVIDSGVEIPHDAKVFPDNSRILGEHTKNDEKIKNIINKIKGQK